MEDSPMKVFVSYLNNENEESKPEEIVLDKEKMSCTELQAKISETFGISSDDYTLFFGLKKLECENTKNLSEFGLRCGSWLHAFQKKEKLPQKNTEVPDFAKVQNAARGLHLMFQHNPMLRRSKSPLAKFLEDREAMDEIISSIEGLSSDRTALDILKNPKLFKVIVNPKNVKIIIEKHPCLASAFISIWNSIMTTNRSSNFDAAASGSSQDNMEVDDRFLSPPSGRQPSTSRGRQNTSSIITSSQLASAIAQATSPGGGSMFPYSAYNTPTPSNNTQSSMPNSRSAASTPTTRRQQASSQPPPITPDVFSQAMQQALVSTGLQEVAETLQSDGATASGSTVSEDVLQAGLNQLRSMGITDDEASRQALTVAQGNVEAAINLLFSGN